MNTERKVTPTGVVIIAGLMLLTAFNGFSGMGSLVRKPLILLFSVCMATLNAVCGVGLLNLKEWSRKTTIVIYFIIWLATIGLFILSLFYHGKPVPYPPLNFFTDPQWLRLFAAIAVAFAGLGFSAVFFYLTHPKIQKNFK